MVKIRIEGIPDEVDAAAELINEVMHVSSISEIFKNRGKNEYVRMYLDCRKKEEEDA